MAATVIMTLIMLYEMIMLLIIASHKRGSEENGGAGVCLFVARRVAGGLDTAPLRFHVRHAGSSGNYWQK
jgi:hypothetical protein